MIVKLLQTFGWELYLQIFIFDDLNDIRNDLGVDVPLVQVANVDQVGAQLGQGVDGDEAQVVVGRVVTETADLEFAQKLEASGLENAYQMFIRQLVAFFNVDFFDGDRFLEDESEHFNWTAGSGFCWWKVDESEVEKIVFDSLEGNDWVLVDGALVQD